ncbi:ARPP-2 domain-containing protein [Kitasatospora cinereorecta]|uniref:ARG and Rhodanese-Phosphatase-superfamily-associated domain-containing protein n=1 Tax=Kitasatospora cinereorecta TaxID=285560 RepID=A0ABW0V3F9_9ACTN
MTNRTTARLDLTGLTTRPAQVWGGVRLVPLVRHQPIDDLRLHQELFGEEYRTVLLDRRTAYTAYIPHGFVADWTRDRTPAAAYGTQFAAPADRPGAPPERIRIRPPRRLAQRAGADRLRFVPLHLALEGYLALHFGGPTIAWEEWSQQALRRGLSPRAEEAYAGASVRGLADALRVFEIHPGQCGLALYVADALAAAFVVPHPDDYRALHRSLLLDLYGELVHHYALLAAPVPDFRADLRSSPIRSLADLRGAVDRQEQQWAAFHDHTMAEGLLAADYRHRPVHRMGRFTLSRFLPAFRPKQENHLGETITDEHGRIAYLKTFRLSESQVRRGHLLDRLAAHDWRLSAAAAELGITEAQFALRLESAGFGHLLRQDILDHYRRRHREGR